MRGDASFSVLASSYKRIRNIIKDNSDTSIDSDKLVDQAEKDLYDLLLQVRKEMAPSLSSQDYGSALKTLLKMKEPVDRFFDEVMVMDEDQDIRRNRLNLLTALGELVLAVGDISRMHEA